MIGLTLFIIIVVVVVIYFLFEFKRMRHKILALILIGLVILSYISMTVILKDKGVDTKTVPGFISAVRLYFSWLGGVFTNIKSITANAVKMDWGTNKTAQDFDGSLVDFGIK